MLGAIILFIIAVFLLCAGIRLSLERGFLFNNAFIYASKPEREKMNKKPYYRQSGIVLILTGLIFLLNGIDVLFETAWIFFVVIAIIVITIIYAIISSVIIEKKKKAN